MSRADARTGNLAERRRAATPAELPMPYDQWKYVKKNTDFSDEVMIHWYNMIKEKSPEDVVCIMLKDTELVIKSVYSDQNHKKIFNEMWNFSDGGLQYIKFKHFMSAISVATFANNTKDVRLDLTAMMCLDIHGKKGKVNQKTLAALLTKAGQLALRQTEKLQKDIDDIFHTLKDVSEDGKMDVAYFRHGIELSDNDITDQATIKGKYHVSTCVPELRTALLAVANYAAYPADISLLYKQICELPTAIIRDKDGQSAAAKSDQVAGAAGIESGKASAACASVTDPANK